MEKQQKWKISLYAMAALYVCAGINHFWHPDFYLAVMPDWLPYQTFANQSSGVAEVILGLLLLMQSTRKFASWMIMAMLTVFFFVIHIPMCFHFEVGTTMFWIAVIRIPLQLVLINWAWKFARNRKPQSAK